jgi:hypothetical protein
VEFEVTHSYHNSGYIYCPVSYLKQNFSETEVCHRFRVGNSLWLPEPLSQNLHISCNVVLDSGFYSDE